MKTIKTHLLKRSLFSLFFMICAMFQIFIIAENNEKDESLFFSYDFEKETPKTKFTSPPAYYITIAEGNSATAGVTSYTDSNNEVSNMLTPYGVGQRNATGVVNLNAFPKKATDYSVIWKQCNDNATGEYKTGVVLRADISEIGTSRKGYVQGIMEGYVLLPYKTPSNGSEFRIYKSTSDVELNMLVNTPASDFSPGAKQPVWYRASVSGTENVLLTLEYSLDSLEWSLGATYTDTDATFQSGATQLLWGLAVTRTDFYFDNITFSGLAEDGIDTPDNPDEPSDSDEELFEYGGEGKHLRTSTMVGNTSREMIIYLPKDLPENRPLLISCHGANQGGEYQANAAKYYMVADTAKFVTVYPEGINKQWNSSGNSDIDFMSEIIDLMYERYKIDKKRVYLSGFSMGSMFTYYAANRMADKIAAFAPTMGYNFNASATSSRPVPILQIIGTTDEAFTNRDGHMDILYAWIKRNGCSSRGRVTSPYPAGSTTSEAVKTLWINQETGIEVVLLTTPKGHWHSNDPVHIMSNLEIWNFCKRYSLDGLISSSPSSLPDTKQDPVPVISQDYYTLTGQRIFLTDKEELKGLYVVVNHLADGTTRTEKSYFE